jgi:hypothetical protein
MDGQHFLAHEDAFPPLLAASNGFQRHATLLLYLNDVPQARPAVCVCMCVCVCLCVCAHARMCVPSGGAASHGMDAIQPAR